MWRQRLVRRQTMRPLIDNKEEGLQEKMAKQTKIG